MRKSAEFDSRQGRISNLNIRYALFLTDDFSSFFPGPQFLWQLLCQLWMSRMAPTSTPRQLWLWSLPSLVVLLSLVWYKRKRNTLRSDPGGTSDHLPESVESEQQRLQEKEKSSPILIQGESACEPDSTIESIEDLSVVSDLIKLSYTKDIEGTVAGSNTPVSEEPLCSVKVSLAEEAHKSDNKVTLSSTAVSSEDPSVSKRASPLNCEALSTTEGAKSVEVEAKEAVQPSVENIALGEEGEKETSFKCKETEISTSNKMTETKDEVEAQVLPSQNDSDKVAVLEDKLASLALGSSEEQRRGAERDSANHSPVDAMLASPSMSSYSDEHSEVGVIKQAMYLLLVSKCYYLKLPLSLGTQAIFPFFHLRHINEFYLFLQFFCFVFCFRDQVTVERVAAMLPPHHLGHLWAVDL